MLSDQVFYALASLYAFEYTAEPRFIDRTEQCLDYAIRHLWDEERGGFNDTVAEESAIGPMSIPSQPIQDSPTPGENAVAALALQRYYLFTGEQRYQEMAERTLERFAGSAADFGTFAGTFGLAVSQLIREPLHILVLGDTSSELWQTACRGKYPMELLQTVDPDEQDRIPEIAKAAVHSLSDDDLPVVLVCTATSCSPPVRNPDELKSRFEELRDRGSTRQ